MSNRILVTGDPLLYEAQSAAADLKAGTIVALDSDSKIAAAAGSNFKVVREQQWTGGGLDYEYAADETAPYYVGQSGQRFQAFLAAEQNVAVGALLEANASGELIANDTGVAIAIALEAKNLTGEAAELTNVEVL